MKKKNDLKNACHHRQESQSLPSSCVTHNEETSLILCKFKHAQISAICNKFRAKLQQLQKCLVDRALRVKANKSKIWRCNTANQDFMLWRNTRLNEHRTWWRLTLKFANVCSIIPTTKLILTRPKFWTEVITWPNYASKKLYIFPKQNRNCISTINLCPCIFSMLCCFNCCLIKTDVAIRQCFLVYLNLWPVALLFDYDNS